MILKLKHLVSSRTVYIAENHSKNHRMFGLFKKKSEREKLQEKYESLQKEVFQLSTTNRKLSDQKAFEADQVMKQLEKLQ